MGRMGRLSLPDDRPPGLDSPRTVALVKHASRAQVWVFRRTNGRIGRTWRIGAGFRKPVPTLLLTHRGRTSGTLYTTPLLYLAERPGAEGLGAEGSGAGASGTGASGAERWVVVASQGGMPKHPQWFHNLRAHPETTIDLPGRRAVPVRARVAGPAERAELWPRLVDLYADFARYAVWAGEQREIPVVVLDLR